MQQNELRRKALMDELGGLQEPDQQIDPTPKVELPPPAGEPLAAPLGASAEPAKADYTKVGQYTSNAYNPEKFARPWDDRSEKYQIGTVLSNFDPRQGITPDVLAALNGANIRGAKFSGGGDKLSVENAGNWDRFGKGGMADVVTGFKGGNGTWGAWTDPALEAQSAPAGGFGGASLDPSLMGSDPNAVIQKLIQQLSGSRPNFEALMAQLGGG